MGRVGGTRPALRRTVGPARLSTSSRPRYQSTSSRAVQRPLSRATPSATPPRQIPSQRQTATASRRRKGPREIPAPAAERPSRPRPPRNGPSPRGVRAAPRRPRRPVARHERAGAGLGQARVGPPTWSPVRSTTAPPKQRSDPTTANTMRPTPGRRTSTDHSRSIPPSGGSPRIPAGRTESRHGHGAEGGPKPPRGAAGRGRPPPWRTRIRRGPSRIGAPGAEEDRSGRGARGSPGKPRLAGGTARATRTGPSDRRARPGLPLTAGDELVSFWFVFKVWTPSSPPDRP